jgi:hypothetical protein
MPPNKVTRFNSSWRGYPPLMMPLDPAMADFWQTVFTQST